MGDERAVTIQHHPRFLLASSTEPLPDRRAPGLLRARHFCRHLWQHPSAAASRNRSDPREVKSGPSRVEGCRERWQLSAQERFHLASGFPPFLFESVSIVCRVKNPLGKLFLLV